MRPSDAAVPECQASIELVQNTLAVIPKPEPKFTLDELQTAKVSATTVAKTEHVQPSKTLGANPKALDGTPQNRKI